MFLPEFIPQTLSTTVSNWDYHANRAKKDNRVFFSRRLWPHYSCSQGQMSDSVGSYSLSVVLSIVSCSCARRWTCCARSFVLDIFWCRRLGSLCDGGLYVEAADRLLQMERNVFDSSMLTGKGAVGGRVAPGYTGCQTWPFLSPQSIPFLRLCLLVASTSLHSPSKAPTPLRTHRDSPNRAGAFSVTLVRISTRARDSSDSKHSSDGVVLTASCEWRTLIRSQ